MKDCEGRKEGYAEGGDVAYGAEESRAVENGIEGKRQEELGSVVMRSFLSVPPDGYGLGARVLAPSVPFQPKSHFSPH